jgi:hypothetical protein
MGNGSNSNFNEDGSRKPSVRKNKNGCCGSNKQSKPCCHPKCVAFQKSLAAKMNHEYFTTFVIFLIVLNSVTLATEHYEQPDKLTAF